MAVINHRGAAAGSVIIISCGGRARGSGSAARPTRAGAVATASVPAPTAISGGSSTTADHAPAASTDKLAPDAER